VKKLYIKNPRLIEVDREREELYLKLKNALKRVEKMANDGG